MNARKLLLRMMVGLAAAITVTLAAAACGTQAVDPPSASTDVNAPVWPSPAKVSSVVVYGTP